MQYKLRACTLNAGRGVSMNRFIIIMLVIAGFTGLAANTISGRVENSVTGEGILAEVILHSANSPADSAHTALSDSSGYYSFSSFPDGVYILQAFSFYWDYYPMYYDGVSNPFDATPIVVNPSNPTHSNIDFHLDQIDIFFGEGTMSGTVFDEANQPLAGIQVSLVSTVPGYALTYSDSTDMSGNFNMQYILSGEYHLGVVNQWGYLDYYLPGSFIFDDNNQDYNQVEVHLDRQLFSNLSGFITDEETGLPISGGNVYTYSPVGNNPNGFFETTTDDTGFFSLIVPWGDYIVGVDHDNYASEFYENTSDPLQATLIRLAEQGYQVDMSLAPNVLTNFSISGNITVSDSIPGFECLIIVIASEEDEDWVEDTLVLSDGSYLIENIPSQDYFVLAISTHAPPTYYQDVNNWDSAVIVSVDGHETGVDIDLDAVIGDGIYTLEGSVMTPQRNVVSSAYVILYDDEDRPCGFGLSDEAGHFQISYIPNGNITAMATKTFFEMDTANLPVYSDLDHDFYINRSTTAVTDKETISPANTSLRNYPNPFNPETTISFSLEKSSKVEIDIYNIRGELTKTLVNNEFSSGVQTVIWNGTDNKNKQAASGIYLYRMRSNKKIITRKMVLLK